MANQRGREGKKSGENPHNHEISPEICSRTLGWEAEVASVSIFPLTCVQRSMSSALAKMKTGKGKTPTQPEVEH